MQYPETFELRRCDDSDICAKIIASVEGLHSQLSQLVGTTFTMRAENTRHGGFISTSRTRGRLPRNSEAPLNISRNGEATRGMKLVLAEWTQFDASANRRWPRQSEGNRAGADQLSGQFTPFLEFLCHQLSNTIAQRGAYFGRIAIVHAGVNSGDSHLIGKFR